MQRKWLSKFWDAAKKCLEKKSNINLRQVEEIKIRAKINETKNSKIEKKINETKIWLFYQSINKSLVRLTNKREDTNNLHHVLKMGHYY